MNFIKTILLCVFFFSVPSFAAVFTDVNGNKHNIDTVVAKEWYTVDTDSSRFMTYRGTTANLYVAVIDDDVYVSVYPRRGVGLKHDTLAGFRFNSDNKSTFFRQIAGERDLDNETSMWVDVTYGHTPNLSFVDGAQNAVCSGGVVNRMMSDSLVLFSVVSASGERVTEIADLTGFTKVFNATFSLRCTK